MKKSIKTPIIKRSRLFSGLMIAMSGVSHAAIINVDDNACDLVDAIEAANTDLAVNGCSAGNGDDVIKLVKTTSSGNQKPIHTLSSQHVPSAYIGGTYVGTPVITSHITIEGEDQQITAQPAPDPFRVFEVIPGGTLILNNVTVNGGDDGRGLGSGVLNFAGTLEINQSTLYGHKGAIASMYGTTTINQTVLTSNTNEYSTPPAAFIYGSLFNMSNSSVINNVLEQFPPLYGDSPNPFKQNKGGPVSLPPATIQLIESESKLVNSTISGNANLIGALAAGENTVPPPIISQLKKHKAVKGGLSVGTTLSHLTVSDNKGYVGGVFFSEYHNVTLEGNIISGNVSLLTPLYANGLTYGTSPNADAHNFLGENGQTGFYGLTPGASDVVFSNAAADNLYPLNRSNKTFIHPLKHGSAAIDGLAKSCYQGLPIDQEGKGRGIDGDSNGTFVCDAGAFEHSLPITVGGACTLQNALVSANNDGSVGGCQPGIGHDIINLPENSTHTGTSIVDTYVLNTSNIFGVGLPVIRSGVVINGNGATIERDTNSLENFNMLTIAEEGGLILYDTTVSGANDGLAAVASWFRSEVQVFNSTITNNEVSGLLSVLNHNSGIHYSSITNNDNSQSVFYTLAAGVVGSISHNFQLKNSLIANNTATYGLGAVQLSGNQNTVVSNNTISGNSGYAVGGIVLQQNTALVTHNTITGNSGSFTGGFYAGYSINTRLSHNIISGNEITPPPPPSPNSSHLGQFPMLGMQSLVTPAGGPTYAEMAVNTPISFSTNQNVFGQNGLSGTSGFTLDTSDIVPVGATSTVISPTLADNGGPTLTHLPAPGSVAIDGGDSNCEFNLRDQRGFVRPWDGDDNGSEVCDIGAVEANSVAIADLIFKDGFEATIILR